MWRRLAKNRQKAISLIYLCSCLALRSKTFPKKRRRRKNRIEIFVCVCARNLNNRSFACKVMRNRKKSNNTINRKCHPLRSLCGCATMLWGDRKANDWTQLRNEYTQINKWIRWGPLKWHFIGLQNENILRIYLFSQSPWLWPIIHGRCFDWVLSIFIIWHRINSVRRE